MYTDKLTPGKNIFHFNHRLMRNNNVFSGMNFKIVLHSFYINNIRKTDPEKLYYSTYKNMFAVYRFYFSLDVLKIFPSIILSIVLENRS